MVSKMVGIRLKKGQRVRLETPGGGGYGPVAERDPEQVRRDVEQGYVGPEEAWSDYRVALTADGAVDPAATAALRGAASGQPA